MDFKHYFWGSMRSGIFYKIVFYCITLVCGYLVSSLVELAILENWNKMYSSATWTVITALLGAGAGYFLYSTHSKKKLDELQGFREFLYRATLSRQINAKNPGEWDVYFSEDVTAIAQYFQETVPDILSSSVTLLFSGILLCLSDWRVGALFICISLSQLLPVIIYEKWARQIYNDTQTNEEAYRNWILEGLNGAAEIRSYNCHTWYLNRFCTLNTKTLNMGRKAEQTATVESIISTSIECLLNYGSYVILGAFVLYGGVGVVQLPIMIVLSRYVFSSVSALISQRLQQIEYQEACQRLNISTYSKDTTEESNNSYLVKIQSVTKSYDTKKVLRNAEFQIKKGEKIFLQGENGSGKSTLLRIILGLEHADNGQLFFQIPRDSISYSLQEYPSIKFLAKDIAAEVTNTNTINLCELEKGLKAFGIISLLDKPLCELSQGERKKFFLALSLSKKSELLILDEPTNHLDTQSVASLNNRLAHWDGAVILCGHNSSIDLCWNRTITVDKGVCHEQ